MKYKYHIGEGRIKIPAFNYLHSLHGVNNCSTINSHRLPSSSMTIHYRIGNWRAGWFEAPSLSSFEIMDIFQSIFGPMPSLPLFKEYFPNLSIQRYIWRKCAHDNRLYASTIDLRAMFEGIIQMLGEENEDHMEGLVSFFKLVNSNRSGFDLYFTENGTDWTPITQDGGFGETFG